MPDRCRPSRVIVLAGGEATRLPGKLFLDAGDVPMLVRVYRNVCAGPSDVHLVQGRAAVESTLLIDAPRVVDRWPLRGPLAGLLSTMEAMRDALGLRRAPATRRSSTRRSSTQLAAHDRAGRRSDRAAPQRDGRAQIEPLAALYAREAFLREGLPVLAGGNGALRAVIERLHTRYVDVAEERVFTNVNTPDDYAALHASVAVTRDALRSRLRRARKPRDPGRRELAGARVSRRRRHAGVRRARPTAARSSTSTATRTSTT